MKRGDSMKKRLQQLNENQSGQAELLGGLMLLAITVLIFFILQAYDNLGREYRDKPIKLDARIEFMNTLRDIEVKVESENVTKADNQLLDNAISELPDEYSIELETFELKTKLSGTLRKLIQDPSDTYLKRTMTETLNQTKQYVIDHEF